MSQSLTPEAVFNIALEERERETGEPLARVADVATFTIRRRK